MCLWLQEVPSFLFMMCGVLIMELAASPGSTAVVMQTNAASTGRLAESRSDVWAAVQLPVGLVHERSSARKPAAAAVAALRST